MVGVEFPLSNGARRSSLLANCAETDKVPLVAKIAQEVGWEVVWDAAISRGVWSIRRL